MNETQWIAVYQGNSFTVTADFTGYTALFYSYTCQEGFVTQSHSGTVDTSPYTFGNTITTNEICTIAVNVQ